MKILLNILGIALVFAICWAFSYNRKAIKWKSIGIMLAVEFVIAFVIVKVPVGQKLITVYRMALPPLSAAAMRGWNLYLATCLPAARPISMCLSSRAWAILFLYLPS